MPRFASFISAAALALLTGCGQSPDCLGGEIAAELYPMRSAAVEDCLGLQGSWQVKVRYEPTAPCPFSGRRCCIAGHVVDCGDGSGDLCGAAGLYDSACRTIRLPDVCDDAFEHELIHAIRDVNGLSRASMFAHDAEMAVCGDELEGEKDGQDM